MTKTATEYTAEAKEIITEALNDLTALNQEFIEQFGLEIVHALITPTIQTLRFCPLGPKE